MKWLKWRVQYGIFSNAEKFFNAIQADFDIIKGISVGKSKITFCVPAEIYAWRNAHTGLFQYFKGQFIGPEWPLQLPRICMKELESPALLPQDG